MNEPNVDWPTSAGIWMGFLPSINDWLPMRVKLLKEYPEGEAHLPMPLVAQFPVSKDSWPFLFQGNHPAKKWRQLTAAEQIRAKKFYGETK